MILAIPLALALVLGVAFGGQLDRLARLPVRALSLVVIGFLAEIAAGHIGTTGTIGNLVYRVVLMGGLATVAAGFWGLRRVTGFWLAFAGLSLNILVMAANGGTMTTTREAVVQSGFAIVDPSGEARVEGAGKTIVRSWADTRLPWLTDWLQVQVGSFHRVLSPGDVLLALGIGVMVFCTVRPIGAAKSELTLAGAA